MRHTYYRFNINELEWLIKKDSENMQYCGDCKTYKCPSLLIDGCISICIDCADGRNVIDYGENVYNGSSYWNSKLFFKCCHIIRGHTEVCKSCKNRFICLTERA